MPNRCINRKQIALIHVAKQQLGMSDEIYREMLGSVGVLSSVQLDERRFNELMLRLEAGGFRATGKKASTKSHEVGRSKAKVDESTPERTRMIAKIEALLRTMNLTLEYAEGIAIRMWGIKKLTWCNPNQLRGIVAALVKRQQKVRGEASGVRSKTPNASPLTPHESGASHAV